MAGMTDLAAAPRTRLGDRTTGFDRDLRGRCRGAQEPFLARPLFITELGLETNDLLLQFVNLPLLLQTLFAVRHPRPCPVVLPIHATLMEVLIGSSATKTQVWSRGSVRNNRKQRRSDYGHASAINRWTLASAHP
jgi:hypothetical protein